MERKARASARAARSEPAPEAMRTRSSRSPCSPELASVHFPGVPGGASRTKSERPLHRGCRRRPSSGRSCGLRQVSPADLLGACAEGGRDGGGVHGAPLARMTPSPEAGRRIGSGSMQDLSRGCRGSGRVPATARPPAGAGTAGDARSASVAVRPGSALNGLQEKRPVPRGRDAEPARVSGREGPAKSLRQKGISLPD